LKNTGKLDKEKVVYLAGPLFSYYERTFLEKIDSGISQIWWRVKGIQREEIEGMTSICFLPHRDAGDVGINSKERKQTFDMDIHAIDKSQIIVALLDGPDVDSGTAVELGYAYSIKKKIFGLLTDNRRWTFGETRSNSSNIAGLNNMIWGVCSTMGTIYGDLDALYTGLETYFGEVTQ
jgi:nucleoside 2-deoxyribosyltransferase